jgi:putative toxin-antitoxin system antitoxin component (TIGR02293 family)
LEGPSQSNNIQDEMAEDKQRCGSEEVYILTTCIGLYLQALHKMPQKVWHNVHMSQSAVAPTPSNTAFRLGLADIERGVPLATLDQFSGYSGIPLKDILEAVIPLRTLKHRRERKESLNIDESDRLARVARLYDLAIRVFGNPDKARRWLTRPKDRFDGRTPVNMMRSDAGGRGVEEMLYQIDDGMFA